MLESEKNLTKISVDRIENLIKEGNLSDEQLQFQTNKLTMQKAQLDVQQQLLTDFKIEQGLQEDLEEIERRKRIEKNKQLRLEKEAAEKAKERAKEEKKQDKLLIEIQLSQ